MYAQNAKFKENIDLITWIKWGPMSQLKKKTLQWNNGAWVAYGIVVCQSDFL